MKTLVHWISKGTPYKAASLLGVGLSMLICSSLAERISGALAREIAQLLIIASGFIATAILFRRRTESDRR
jgi:hypothetical protein